MESDEDSEFKSLLEFTSWNQLQQTPGPTQLSQQDSWCSIPGWNSVVRGGFVRMCRYGVLAGSSAMFIWKHKTYDLHYSCFIISLVWVILYVSFQSLELSNEQSVLLLRSQWKNTDIKNKFLPLLLPSRGIVRSPNKHFFCRWLINFCLTYIFNDIVITFQLGACNTIRFGIPVSSS